MHITVNGMVRDVNAPPGYSLLSLLRDDLGLTGAHYGCGRGACGACYVLVDRKVVPACITALDDVVGKEIVTIEGLVKGELLHPVQQAFLDEDAMQCGAAPAAWSSPRWRCWSARLTPTRTKSARRSLRTRHCRRLRQRGCWPAAAVRRADHADIPMALDR